MAAGLAGWIDRQHLARRAFIFDLVDQSRSDLVAVPGHAKKRLIEMGMGLDQAGQRQSAYAVDHRDAVCCQGAAKGDYPSFPDQDVNRLHSGGDAVGTDISDKQAADHWCLTPLGSV